jgi:hypothetical protein
MVDYWFKPKSFGYGATPTNWRGWATTLGFVVMMIGWSIASPALLHWSDWAIWFAGVAALTAAYTALARRKTAGEWKWRGVGS